METIVSNKGSFIKQLLSNLTFYVLIAIGFGIWLGAEYPATAVRMELIGKTFVDIIKLFITPIIFLTIVLGISSIGNLKKVGRIGIKSLLYFEVVTTLALGIGIIVALVLQPGKIDKSGLSIQDASKFTKQAGSHFDWIKFFQSNLTLQVLVASIIIGIVLNYSKYRLPINQFLGKVSHYVFLALK